MGIIAKILTAIVLYIGIFIIKEIINYFHLKKYKSQGLVTIYKPLLGFLYYVIPTEATQDHNKGFRDIFSEYPKEDMIIINKPLESGSVILLKSPESVSSFIKSEKDTIKRITTNLDFFGLFFKNGKRAMKEKGIFAKIFHQENLDTLCPGLVQIVDFHIQKLIRERCSKERFTQIDIKNDFFNFVFQDITQKILFGYDDIKETPKLKNGMTIVKAIETGIALSFEVIKSRLNVFTFKLAGFLNLIPERREFLKLRKEVSELVIEIYKERLRSGKKFKTTNFMDSVIEHNESCKNEEEKLNLNDVFSNFELFQFAASDTSFYVTTSTLVLLSQEENWGTRDMLFKDLEGMPKESNKVTREILDGSETLAKTIKESMRVMSPVVRNAPRFPTKDIEILGKTVYKGDMIFINQTALNFDPEIFENPDKFDIERFSKENEKKLKRNSYIPFSVGQRNCVGQYLGQLMAKITISRFLKHFEIEEVKGFGYKKTAFPVYGFEKAMINIRVR